MRIDAVLVPTHAELLHKWHIEQAMGAQPPMHSNVPNSSQGSMCQQTQDAAVKRAAQAMAGDQSQPNKSVRVADDHSSYRDAYIASLQQQALGAEAGITRQY